MSRLYLCVWDPYPNSVEMPPISWWAGDKWNLRVFHYSSDFTCYSICIICFMMWYDVLYYPLDMLRHLLILCQLEPSNTCDKHIIYTSLISSKYTYRSGSVFGTSTQSSWNGTLLNMLGIFTHFHAFSRVFTHFHAFFTRVLWCAYGVFYDVQMFFMMCLKWYIAHHTICEEHMTIHS